MAGLIPENILEDILSRVDIVEVISGYIPLKRAGRNFKASCPFHHEKTPSFMVSPDRQIYHCFGCSASGNAFKFLMQYERMEFLEAVEALAKKAGVVLPQPQAEDQKAAGLITQLYRINELTAQFYAHNLETKEAQAAKNYLLKRGLSLNTLKSFQLGFALDKWDALMHHLGQKNFPLALLEKAGLILPKDAGGYYDRFRHRIIFPIFDIKSRAIGFGARVLDDSLPKYVNSPETPIYVKGRNLYGLNLARDAIRENDYVVVVEGYLDAVMPYQEGLQNIVASLGTALTYEQARLIKRYTRNVVVVYDADAAGQTAALRSLDIFIEEEMNVRVVSLPQGLDPDTYVRKEGIAGFKEKITQAENLFDYKLRMLKERHSPDKIEGKSMIAGEMLATIKKFNNAVLKSEYIRRLAQELDVQEDALLQELKKVKDVRPGLEFTARVAKPGKAINPTEKLLIKLMLENAQVCKRIRENLEPADFHDERASRIVSIIFDLSAEGKNIEPHKLINYFSDDDMAEMMCELTLGLDIADDKREEIVDNCIKRLKNEKLKFRRQRLHEEIKSAQSLGDDERLRRLMSEFHELTKVVMGQGNREL